MTLAFQILDKYCLTAMYELILAETVKNPEIGKII